MSGEKAVSSNNFFAELKRRNVFRAAAFYAASAWLLVQVATQVFPFFHIAEWVVRWIVIASIIGFPFAMLFSYYYEWTPHGLQLESKIAPNESIARHTGKKLDRWIIAILSIAVVLLLTDRFVLHKDARASAEQSTTSNKSIAVLPFLNEGGDPANEYFSDGLSEELIAALAQIGDLKVIGRSSSFRFKGKNEESKTVGEKLGVGTLLEGTVRKQQDEVRIVAELINAKDGRELWSQTFNRALKDIFAVQAEIAQAVAGSLKLTLLGKEDASIRNTSTESVEAHNAYLQGHFYFQRRNPEDFRKAVGFFEEAIRLDPKYALAYAERSEAWTWIADQSGVKQKEGVAAARNDAEKAVAIDPHLAEAHAALGWVRSFGEWRFDDGITELRRAKELSPGNPTVNDLLGRIVVYFGRFEEAETLAREAIKLDPLSYQSHNSLARVLAVQGKLDEADAVAHQAIELQPTAASSRRWPVIIAVLRGNGERALREAQLEPNAGYRRFEIALAHTARTDHPAADAALDELITQDREIEAYQIAQVCARRGESEKAFEWLQIAFDQHDTGILGLLIDPLMRDLHHDPRYGEMLAKVGLPASL